MLWFSDSVDFRFFTFHKNDAFSQGEIRLLKSEKEKILSDILSINPLRKYTLLDKK
jgi:hypothetical protein